MFAPCDLAAFATNYEPSVVSCEEARRYMSRELLAKTRHPIESGNGETILPTATEVAADPLGAISLLVADHYPTRMPLSPCPDSNRGRWAEQVAHAVTENPGSS